MIAEVTMLDTGSPTRQASEEAKAIATKYGLGFLRPKNAARTSPSGANVSYGSMVLKKSAVSAAEPLFGALKGYLLLRPFGIAVPRPIWGAARRI
jgi:hypothetical protein